MKKLFSILLALTMLLVMGIPAAAASKTVETEISYRGIKIVVDGDMVNPCDANGDQVEPFILDGTTYLPVRAVADALGLGVEWDGGTSTVTLTGKKETVYLLHRSSAVFMNDVLDETEYSYDENGRILSVCTEDYSGYEERYTYAYDEDGRLSSIKVWARSGSVTVSIDAYCSYLENDEVRLTFIYDLDGEQDTFTALYTRKELESSASFETMVDLLLSYGSDVLDLEISTDNTYDENDRLSRQEISISGSVSVYEYTYDEYGNRLSSSRTFNGTTELTEYKFIYDETGRPIQVEIYLDGVLQQKEENTYDINGNLSQKKLISRGIIIFVNYQYITLEV